MTSVSAFVQKLIFYLLLAAFFFEVLLIGSQFIEKNEGLMPRKDLFEHTADQKMERVHLVEGLGSSKEWELFAEAAEGYIGQGVWNLENVKVVFYARTGDSYVVQGKRGQIDVGSKDIDIVGDVSTHSTNGYEFVTPALHYRSKAKVLNAPEALSLKGPKDQAGQRLRLRGRGITTYLENSLMNIESDVVAERQMSNLKNLKIQSRKAQVSGRSNMVRFYDSVTMYYDNFSIQGPEALFAYKADADVPQAIVINGGVQISDVDKKASAENLKIDLLEDRYVLRGSPRVQQGSEEIKGEEIIFLEGGKKVRIENVKARVNDDQEVK
jgi:LPS export ABC transporter protein LptC